MTIEAQLQELIEVNKAILVAIQSSAQVTVAAAAAEAAAPKKRRTKAEIAADEAAAISAAVVDGDPEGTKYWHSEKNALVFAQLPTEAAPAEGSEFMQVSADVYLAAKAAYEKKPQVAAAESAATTSQAAASTAPSATAQPATASVATSGGEPTWDEVVKALRDLAGNPAHGGAAVKAIIAQIDPSAANVPALQALNKNAEILAAVNALLNPQAAAAATDDPLFG